MIKRLLFMTEKKSMIANALVDGLRAALFEVTQVKTNVTEISHVENVPEIWLLYLQDTDKKMTDVLSYIKDQVDEKNIRFYMIGTTDELASAMKSVPGSYVKGTFTRPFRVDEIADKLTIESDIVQRMKESRRILIIDDDATMLRRYKDMLSGRYRVYTANSGMNAIQMLVSTEVDLILLDYEMPVIKGPKVLEMLRSEPHTKNIPVMFLTSKNDRESIIAVMELNPVNYLLKSLSNAEIIDKIDSFFETLEE
ncbi:MAG: response regulator [Lachnospiraceae bacterium]|nr:response regulator [Lachnospiraceae bacterium]